LRERVEGLKDKSVKSVLMLEKIVEKWKRLKKIRGAHFLDIRCDDP
jgi:hypothetical protein